MKNKTAVLLMALGLMLPATTFGQTTEPAPRSAVKRSTQRKMAATEGVQPATPVAVTSAAATPAGPRQRSVPPLIAAIDVNHDEILDAAEIAKASESLRKLDKNGDGTLTAEEVRSQRSSHSRSTPSVGTEAGAAGTALPSRSRLGALDANHDGVIDATEISAASQVLAKLDKDGDGKVSLEELRSQRTKTTRAPRSSDRASKE